MTRAGHIAWQGLSLRAKVDEAWAMAMPDVFSVRHPTLEACLEPIVHEIKVQRSDRLSDLRSAAKRAADLQLSSECWYVIRGGIVRPEEIPPRCGVLVATETALDVARPVPKRAMQMPFGCGWRWHGPRRWKRWRLEDAQAHLGDTQGPPPET